MLLLQEFCGTTKLLQTPLYWLVPPHRKRYDAVVLVEGKLMIVVAAMNPALAPQDILLAAPPDSRTSEKGFLLGPSTVRTTTPSSNPGLWSRSISRLKNPMALQLAVWPET